MSKSEVVKELHKQARKNFKRRHVIIKGLDDLWQADLVEMIPYRSSNTGYCFLLTVIDTFSKYAWAVPLKSKTGLEVSTAIELIFKKGRIPKNLQTDDGKEFYNHHFQNVMQKYKINHYSTYSILKASIVERFNRTLKGMMWREFSMRGNYRWINFIHQLIKNYNSKIHRTIQMQPRNVKRDNEKSLLATVYSNLKIAGKAKYKVDEYVRISKYKHVFAKGYTPNWTTEIFKINKINHTNPVTYMLEDLEGNQIKGGFYEQEISKVKYPDLYLVEKVLKHKKNKVFAKWLGFPSTHNSWIRKSDIL